MTGRHLLLSAVLFAAGCAAALPTGPSVMVLPGGGKAFQTFQGDDAVCRQWASEQVGTTTERASTAAAAGSAVAGTALGAAAGAAIGAAAGSPGTGAAVGAGVGLLGGSAVGADRARYAGGSVQHRYDIAYMQCMYAKGNQIPVAAKGFQSGYLAPAPPPPPVGPPPGVPPPPAGPPPAPPPGPAK